MVGSVFHQGRVGELFKYAIRRPLLTVFTAALIPRLAVALVVRFQFNGYVYLDDQSYLEAFHRYAESGGAERPAIWDSVPSYSRPIALLYRYVLDDPLSALIPTVLAGSLSAFFVAFAVGRLTNSRRSLVAGLVVAWWPSQIFWSSLALRDAFIWMAVSSLLASLAVLRSNRRLSVGLAVGLHALIVIVYVAGNRKHSAFALTLAVVMGLLIWRRSQMSVTLALIAFACGPLALGFGPFGWELWKNGTSGVTEQRAREVSAAETPIRCWDLPFLPPGDEASGGWRDDLLCTPTTAPSFLFSPFPSQVRNNPDLVPPLLELPAWILLYFAALKSPLFSRTRGLAGTVTVTYLVATVAMWSFIDRAVGTAFRHRGEILASLVVISAATTRLTQPRLSLQKVHLPRRSRIDEP